jgi:hypothetical protein
MEYENGHDDPLAARLTEVQLVRSCVAVCSCSWRQKSAGDICMFYHTVMDNTIGFPLRTAYLNDPPFLAPEMRLGGINPCGESHPAATKVQRPHLSATDVV